MKLHCERLESRDNPGLIAGWDGETQLVYGDLNGDNVVEEVAIAGEGGSAHVVVDDGRTGERIGNFIAFENTFRGGGHATILEGRLIVVPGEGGGPRVMEWTVADGVVANYFAPLGPDYRGGAEVISAPLLKSSDPEVIVLLAGSEIIAIDPASKEVINRFAVGEGWRFEPSGSWREVFPGIGVTLDRGDVTGNYVAETETWNLLTGVPVG